MTDTTYYTPEENELRIGLECEILIIEHYRPYTIEAIENYIYASLKLTESRLRVRHLTHEDITGCGWAQVSNHLNVSVRKYSYTTDNPHIFFELLAEKTVITIFRLGTANENCVFDGTVLNKSELLFLMARLGIVK